MLIHVACLSKKTEKVNSGQDITLEINSPGGTDNRVLFSQN